MLQRVLESLTARLDVRLLAVRAAANRSSSKARAGMRDWRSSAPSMRSGDGTGKGQVVNAC